ncbi:MAG: hypothetical protein BAJALOKI3v1_210006 [Promethearchaeota archaeon]|nr:MAG: hypothetical protein BAJALOKI3v1_210006 [Candidatus Lokiarchaeota archaeon]
MTTSYFQNKKRTAKQTISISPALKDWIERYVQKNHNMHPEDERYDSISAFYNYILENALDFLEDGKNIDDFNNQFGKKEKSLFDLISFSGIISLHEKWLEMNRYREINFRKLIPVLFMVKNELFLEKSLYNPNDIEEIFEQCIELSIHHNITKNLRYYLTKSRKREEIILTIEHVGGYRNLQYENLKLLGILLGFLGVELVDLFYSEKDLFAQLEFQTTELFFSYKKSRIKRIELIQRNYNYFQDYHRLMDDMDHYFWMEVEESETSYLKFNNVKVLENWINKIEEDLSIYDQEEKISFFILKFFQKLNWIKPSNTKRYEYCYNLDKKDNKAEIKALRKILSKYTNIIETNGKIHLKHE